MTAATPLSIDTQIRCMKAAWPTFDVHGIDRPVQAARWVGHYTPQFTRYRLEIRYRLGGRPEVRILSPALVRLPGNAEGALPHVYPPADDPTLCIYDPEAAQWDWSMPIATTIVPWSFDWIACYELWLITGNWTGGGRHAGDLPTPEPSRHP